MRRTAALALPFVLALALWPAPPARAYLSVPTGFVLKRSYLGAALYSRQVGARTDYVQVVSLPLGGRLQLLTGTVTDPGTGLGAYGHDNPAFQRLWPGDFWKLLGPARLDSFSVASGALFALGETPAAHLSHPLKRSGAILTDGAFPDSYPGRKVMLTLGATAADAVPFTPEALAAVAAPALLTGLATAADPSPGLRTGRTLAGLRDADGDGAFEVVLVYSCSAATRAEAVGALTAFGATRFVALAGGASTQLAARGATLIPAKRTLPQAIGVRGAASTPAGSWLVTRTVKRAGACTYNFHDLDVSTDTRVLKKLPDGFSFEPFGFSTTRTRYAHPDRGVVDVTRVINCNGTLETHAARGRAVFTKGGVSIPPYRVTWCEQLGCVFDESFTFKPVTAGAPGGVTAAGTGAVSCAGAGCAPAEPAAAP